ncbi:16S rRNA (cytosine(1402)-N(4))-methyltransferase RsmH [Candidatus Hydrogenosomobacter endosymbioticus]|uniref:Ribosomal RNA small subunit methyltransferase H n=1 Tax=Candidatus Hydrogenosomobacter endosymbioticus TaxID=2558174 RepID=A0ABM7V8W4_9PROT|nr:16S rRNA (cytosine(1402)-N(4))-methyltransferase RsmH [Candidatus Hydrogenosomobacter endosymbioticus]BDB96239.1 ribosomal RNA small subunit methyltransferase H [Candidatus Hydrogenosomobacter endosymbioticus]
MNHIPVMLKEVLDLMCSDEKSSEGLFLDATFGRGGHTCALLERLPGCKVIAIDRDPDAISYGQRYLCDKYADRLKLVHGCFSDMMTILSDMLGEDAGALFSGVLMDLGVSSAQIDSADRGFSFMRDGPLDMRMGKNGNTAADIVNSWSEKNLADLFFNYGEERHSRKIARRIVSERRRAPFFSTGQLAHVIKSEIKFSGRLHPATKVFQALRIAVNDEMNELSKALPLASSLLTLNGCIVVLSFHSLEDRIVKQFFRSIRSSGEKRDKYEKESAGEDDVGCIKFKVCSKPVVPSDEEVRENPRSRSAKLRWAIKVCDGRKKQ